MVDLNSNIMLLRVTGEVGEGEQLEVTTQMLRGVEVVKVAGELSVLGKLVLFEAYGLLGNEEK